MGWANCEADNRDTVYYVTPTSISYNTPTNYGIPINKGQAIIVVALDHYLTKKCSVYCNISLSTYPDESTFGGALIGSIGQETTQPFDLNPNNLTQAMKIIYFPIPPDLFPSGQNQIRVYGVERIYINPSLGVGPSYSTILPSQIFIGPVVEALPTSASISLGLIYQQLGYAPTNSFI